MILSLIVGDLWHQITPVLFAQNLPMDIWQYLNIIPLVVAGISGLFAVIYFMKFLNEKLTGIPPRIGTQYEQIACPKCGYPSFVYPPTKDYTRVVLSRCKDKGVLQENHNLKGKAECSKCRKEFGFYWCRGHPSITGLGNKKGYKSKLDPKLWDADDLDK